MGIGVTIVVSLLLVAATIIMHYELLQFAGTLPRRLTVPTRPRIIIVIGVVLAAHILEASLYAAAYYVLQTQFRMGGLGGHLEGDLLDKRRDAAHRRRHGDSIGVFTSAPMDASSSPLAP